jgi:hypothetical protein
VHTRHVGEAVRVWAGQLDRVVGGGHFGRAVYARGSDAAK